MTNMSDQCKISMTKDFGFNDKQLLEIEHFINQNNNKTAKEILDALILNKKLDNKQKIVIAYIIGNSAREIAMKQELKDKEFTLVERELPDIPLIGG